MSVTWSNPALLMAMGVVVIPVVIHLLARLWHRRVEFSALMFLPTGRGRRERLGRLRQATLLLIRCGALALLVLALAGPRGSRGDAKGGRGVSLLIVLDASPSMGLEVAGRSRLDDARRIAAAAVASLAPGDRAGLIIAGSNHAAIPPRDDVAPVIEALSSVQPGSSGCDLRRALEQAADLLASTPPRRRLLVFSDLQERNFEQLDSTSVERLSRRLGELGIDATLLRVGSADADNLAVRDLRVLNPPLVRDVVAEIEIELQHLGSGPIPPVPLTVSASGRKLDETLVSIEPGERRVIRRSVRLPQSGPQVISATLEAGDLQWDNRFELAADVGEPIGVLVLADAPVGNGPPTSSAEFVRAALAPFRAAGVKGADVARVEIVPTRRYPEAWRPSHRVIVVIGGGGLRDAQVRALEQFVYGGGGLILVPDPGVAATTMAERLWRQGRSLLPARPTVWRRFDAPVGVDGTSPAWWREGRQAIAGARVMEAIEFDTPEDETVVGLKLENGLPLLLERRFGRGRLAAWATPLDTESGNLPLGDSFLPLMQALLRHVSTPTGPDRQVAQGAPIIARFVGTRETTGLVVRPDGTEQRVPLLPLGDDAELRYERTDQPGRYRVQVRGAAEQPFVVLRDPEESRLVGISEQDPRVERLFGQPRDTLDPPPAATRPRGELDLAPLLLLATASLLALDPLVAGGSRGRERAA